MLNLISVKGRGICHAWFCKMLGPKFQLLVNEVDLHVPAIDLTAVLQHCSSG